MIIGVHYMSARLIVVRVMRQWTAARTRNVGLSCVEEGFGCHQNGPKKVDLKTKKLLVALMLDRGKNIVRNLALFNLLQLLSSIALHMNQL